MSTPAIRFVHAWIRDHPGARLLVSEIGRLNAGLIGDQRVDIFRFGSQFYNMFYPPPNASKYVTFARAVEQRLSQMRREFNPSLLPPVEAMAELVPFDSGVSSRYDWDPESLVYRPSVTAHEHSRYGSHTPNLLSTASRMDVPGVYYIYPRRNVYVPVRSSSSVVDQGFSSTSRQLSFQRVPVARAFPIDDDDIYGEYINRRRRAPTPLELLEMQERAFAPYRSKYSGRRI